MNAREIYARLADKAIEQEYNIGRATLEAKLSLSEQLGHEAIYRNKLIAEFHGEQLGLLKEILPVTPFVATAISDLEITLALQPPRRFGKVEEALFRAYSASLLKLKEVMDAIYGIKQEPYFDEFLLNLSEKMLGKAVENVQQAYQELNTLGIDKLLDGKLLDQPQARNNLASLLNQLFGSARGFTLFGNTDGTRANTPEEKVSASDSLQNSPSPRR